MIREHEVAHDLIIASYVTTRTRHADQYKAWWRSRPKHQPHAPRMALFQNQLTSMATKDAGCGTFDAADVRGDCCMMAAKRLVALLCQHSLLAEAV